MLRPPPLALSRYPLIYAILVLPLTVVRWINFGLEAHGTDAPSVFNFIVIVVFWTLVST